jgi:hypothetical protein
MGWDDVKKSSGNGGGYLVIKDGDVKKVHIIDEEPKSFHSVFFKAIMKSAQIDPDNNPLKGIKGFDLRQRHAINVYDYDDQKVKILVGSNEMFSDIKAIKEEWGGFDSVDLKVARTGSGFDTKYSIVPTAKCMWNPAMIKMETLFDLETLLAPTDEETIQSYVEGVVPDAKPEKRTFKEHMAEQEEEAEGDTVTDEDLKQFEEFIPEQIEDAPEPMKKPNPTVAKPAPKPPVKAAPAASSSNDRSALITKINSLIKTKLRYKKPGPWAADLQRIGGKGKQSMSQLDIDALSRLLRFVHTVK